MPTPCPPRATLPLLLGALSLLMLPGCMVPELLDLFEEPGSSPPTLAAIDFDELPPAIDGTEAVDASAEASGPPPLVTGIRAAGMLALQHNPSFQIERLNPALEYQDEMTERAAFDPSLSAEVSIQRDHDEGEARTRAGVDSDTRTRDRDLDGSLGIDQRLPTGTRIGISAQRSLDRKRNDIENAANTTDRSETDRWDIDLTQSLLRGRGTAVNLARLRQTKVDQRISRHVLKAAAESLVYQTEATGWDYLLAKRRIEIVEESMKIAEEQLAEVQERIRVGALADIEMAAVQAEVAQRREDLINARSSLAKTRLEFLRLVGVGGAERWSRPLTLTDTPTVPEDTLAPVEAHVQLALKQRPDLAEARLRITRGELDIVRTRNGLLPQLDFFIHLGGSRYASAFDSSGRHQDGHSVNTGAGLQLEYTFGNRGERAAHERSQLSLTQRREALRNQEDLAQVDVRTAFLEVERTAEQIEATKATRKHREQALRSETEKFRVGKSTSILVAQAQRDLVASRIAEIEAVVAQLKARLELYRQEGSLLERRGISIDAP